MSTRFEVTIIYREPTYAEARGIPETEHRGAYVVRVATDKEAKERALAQFNASATQATVGWVRDVQRIECREVG